MAGRKILNRQGINKTAIRLVVTAVIMFGFGFSLVPLYDVLCEVTGLNGKTGVISRQEAKSPGELQEDRLVKVQFVTNVAVGLPWRFKALEKELFVRPGKLTFTNFQATNLSQSSVAGSAVPSVAPSIASRYFNKTDCFCFVVQSLDPNQTKIMPVAFVVDSKIPDNVDVVTLSYTFFKTEEKI
ncbi:cytochrome c oxidase assembly protein [Pseudomonadota bacterium]|nr:cytochrome c oxidase assembly protein [Pseudomonadota bacterium]|tara:strand:- start:95 stop:646 length:552 start_codon:yes stop_codon:yes gene_type:complete